VAVELGTDFQDQVVDQLAYLGDCFEAPVADAAESYHGSAVLQVGEAEITLRVGGGVQRADEGKLMNSTLGRVSR
jgi:hypothetical protein